MGQLLRNAFMCRACGQVVESKHRHDRQACVCGNSTDGGHDYVHRSGALDDMIDMCEWAGDVGDE